MAALPSLVFTPPSDNPDLDSDFALDLDSDPDFALDLDLTLLQSGGTYRQRG